MPDTAAEELWTVTHHDGRSQTFDHITAAGGYALMTCFTDRPTWVTGPGGTTRLVLLVDADVKVQTVREMT